MSKCLAGFTWFSILCAGVVAASPALADCDGPVAVPGTIQWNEESSGVQFCDGTYWKATYASSTADVCALSQKGQLTYRNSDLQYCNGSNYLSVNGASTGVSCSGTAAGTFTYDAGLAAPKWCDGTNWRVVGAVQLGVFAGGRGASSADASSYNFANVSIGAASASRYVLVGVASRSASSFKATAVTVGGVIATQLVSHVDSGSTSGFFIAQVPTGTSAPIVVTFDGIMVRCAIATWSLTNLNSTAAQSIYLQGESTGMAKLIDVSGGGAAFAVSAGTGTTNQISWTNMTKAYSSVLSDDFKFLHTAATLQSPVPLTSRSVTVVNGAAWTNRVGTIITLR